MKKYLKQILPKKLVTFLTSIKKQFTNFKILAYKYGQFRTIKNWECVDRYGNEIPWYTYPAIEYLNNLDFSEKLVFEYGSGNSSTYWSKRAKKVFSVEHDKEWYEKVKTKIRDNQTLLYSELTENYETSIKKLNQKFDIVIIDGRRRVECSKVINKYLNIEAEDGFMVIFDNSNRDRYETAIKYLRDDLKLIEIDFYGFAPIASFVSTTSIFLSRNFNFKPLSKQPKNSMVINVN